MKLQSSLNSQYLSACLVIHDLGWNRSLDRAIQGAISVKLQPGPHPELARWSFVPAIYASKTGPATGPRKDYAKDTKHKAAGGKLGAWVDTLQIAMV